MSSVVAAPAGARVVVRAVDGERKDFPGTGLQMVLIDGDGKTVVRDASGPARRMFVDVPVADNLRDNYRVLASAPGYKDAGVYPVRLRKGATRIVDLMLLPSSGSIHFGSASWRDVRKRPGLLRALSGGAASEYAAEQRYNFLKDTQAGEPLGCLLNLCTAAEQAFLSQESVLSYIETIQWEPLNGRPGLARDRVFAWARTDLRAQLDSAEPAFVPVPAGLHPTATSSFKQTQFQQANLQVTLYENEFRQVGDKPCYLVELDIDYYRDPAAHILLEVAVNAFGQLTDPRTVYALRWMAGQMAGMPEFDPLYTIQRA